MNYHNSNILVERHINAKNVQIAIEYEDNSYFIHNEPILLDKGAAILKPYVKDFYIFQQSQELLDLYFKLQKLVYQVYLRNTSLMDLAPVINGNRLDFQSCRSGAIIFSINTLDLNVSFISLRYLDTSEILIQIIEDKPPLQNLKLINENLFDYTVYPNHLSINPGTVTSIYNIVDENENIFYSFEKIEEAKVMIQEIQSLLNSETKIKTKIEEELPF